jgi:bile acid-coenzyme A ligase
MDRPSDKPQGKWLEHPESLLWEIFTKPTIATISEALPAEVEAAVLRHPDVRSCAVFGKPDADLGAIVHAVIESEAALTLENLNTFLTDHLARAKHPRSIEITSQTVHDDAGKFRKPRVPSPEISA